jgi:hypothetical protein
LEDRCDNGTELTKMRWGMPPPPRAGGYPVTNIRNTSSPHWRAWLSRENRCLVPFNSFVEYAPEPNPETKKKDVVWFALNDDRPLAAFAGIWTEFKGGRGTKSKPVPGPHNVYGFLTTSPNAIVEPIHPKAARYSRTAWDASFAFGHAIGWSPGIRFFLSTSALIRLASIENASRARYEGASCAGDDLVDGASTLRRSEDGRL